jgi:hypothetical protein
MPFSGGARVEIGPFYIDGGRVSSASASKVSPPLRSLVTAASAVTSAKIRGMEGASNNRADSSDR